MRFVDLLAVLAATLLPTVLAIHPARSELLPAPMPHLDLRPMLDERGERLAGMPPARAETPRLISAADPADTILVEADAVLLADGQIAGRSRTTATGASAELLRRFVGDLAGKPLAQTSALMMSRQSIEGQITELALESGASGPAQSASMAYRLMPVALRDGRMSITTQPGPRLVRPILVQLVSHLREKRNADAACPPQIYEQRIRIRLNGEWHNPILPMDAVLSLAGARYESRYRIEGGMLIIVRRLAIDTGLPVCTAEAVAEMAPVIHAAARDVNRKIEFRQGD